MRNYWSRCSNWRPFALTHAARVAVLSTGQQLRRRRTAGCWPMCQRGASSSRLCHGPASCTDAAASGPKCGDRLGFRSGLFGGHRSGDERWCFLLQQLNGFTSAVRCPAGTQTCHRQCDASLAASAPSAELCGSTCRPPSLLAERKTVQCSPALRQQRTPSVTWRMLIDNAADAWEQCHASSYCSVRRHDHSVC